jgi:hypothetical protein
MRSSQELIELINQYESDGEDLCELGEEVKLLSQCLIEAGNVDQALSLMEAYTEEADWPDYGADGYWAEHTQVVDILLNLGMNYEGVDVKSVLFDFMNYPLYFRIGATINRNLQAGEIESILGDLTNDEPCDSFDWEDQFIVVGLFFNQNLTDEVFAKYFQLMDSETVEYVLSLAQGSAYSYGWLFQYAQEFIAESKNTELGKKRILDYLANSNDEFLTPSIRFNDVNLGSKKEIIEAIEDNTYKGIALIGIVANRNKELDGN